MDLPDSLVLGSDGLPARASGPWALDKLYVLERYAGTVTTAMRRKFTGGLVFSDLMAGPGRCVDTKSGVRTEFLGSTLRALDTRFPFTRVIAVESDPVCAAALEQRVRRHERSELCQLFTSDCNDPGIIATMRGLMKGALTLMFVDLLGTEVWMRTLRALTTDRAVDLLITWPEMDLNRNRGQLLEQGDRWDRFFGTDEWRGIARRYGPARRVHALQKLYERQLQQLGYLTEFYGSVRNLRKRALYRPLCASRDQLGMKFFSIAAQSKDATPKLF